MSDTPRKSYFETRFAPGGLNEEIAAWLKKSQEHPYKPAWEIPVSEARAQSRTMLLEEWAGTRIEALKQVKDVVASTGQHTVPVRVYVPEGKGAFPLTLFVHGGGWVVCDLDTHDNLCRALCVNARAIVISVGYRLAPEHPYPAGLDDVYTAAQWAVREAWTLGADSSRIAVAGDSAGGNLSAAFTQLCRERGDLNLRYQLLIYPVTDISSFDRQSYTEFGEGYVVTAEEMKWYARHYVPDASKRADPLVSPLLCADFAGLPSTHVITAEFDLLRDEGEAYARRLHEAGIPVTCTRFNGMTHGFMSMDGITEKSAEAVAYAAEMLRIALY